MANRTPPTIDWPKDGKRKDPFPGPPPTIMKPIVLSPQQRQQVERRRKQTLDRRVYQRLTAILTIAEGKSREEVAHLLGIGLSQLGEWLRVYRNKGLDALCALHYKGDPGKLTAGQVNHLKEKVSTGCFRNSDQIRQWILDTFRVGYTPSGVKDLLRRIGVSYHKVSGFLWKADPDKQHAFVKRIARHQREAKRQEAPRTRRYYVDACHPVWGLDLVYCCWLLVGQRLLVGMGSGRKRLNILGAYCPDDHEYLDYRLTRDNINGEQFVNFLRLLRSMHPEVERFILYVDGARYYDSPVVKGWLKRHPEFLLSQIPAYSPNVNLIERLWKFMRAQALCRWHKTFDDMQAAVSGVLDHLEDYREELRALMTETFHIIEKQDIPVQYREVA
jgi:transposase